MLSKLIKILIVAVLIQLFQQRNTRSLIKKSKKQDIKSHEPQDASKSTNYNLPENLTDGNQDGYADEGDFIKSFANVGLSPWELRQLFLMTDISGNGQIDTHEWRNFHTMFIQKFTEADKDKNLLLGEKEFTDSFGDMPQMRQITDDKDQIKLILNDISGRQDGKDPHLNFFEWMFVRRCAIAWGISNSKQVSISKVELLDAALVIMMPFNQHDGQLKNQIYAALDFQQMKVQFNFVEFCNVFHKFLIWSSMIKHSSIHGIVSKNLLLRCIDDGVGPHEMFLIEDQNKFQSINQAMALLSDDEEIGFDFENFYIFMRVIYTVKQFGRTKYGSLTYDEYISALNGNNLYVQTLPYMQKSFIMDGNYQRGANFTVESEAYVLSQSKVQPIQHRFVQKPLNKKSHFRHRLMKRRNDQQSENTQQNPDLQLSLKKPHEHSNKFHRHQEKEEDLFKKNFTLDKNPFIYFFNMFTSNGDNKLLNFGDMYRIKKYHNLINTWDQQAGPQVFSIYPEALTQEQITVVPEVLFLREKEIIREMVHLYRENKQLDTVQVSLPLDMLGLCRFMAYDQLQVRVTKAKIGEDIAYSSLYIIFSKMGLIPFNMDVNDWLRDIFQGQRGFKSYNQTEDILSQGRKIVDGHQQLLLASIRASKQKQAENQFGSSWESMDPITYHSKDTLVDPNRVLPLGRRLK